MKDWSSYIRAYKLAFFFILFGFVWVVVLHLPTFCLWKFAVGIPCPGCGMTRAVLQMSRFQFQRAAAQNILIAPLLLLGAAGCVCFFADACFNRAWLVKYRMLITSRGAIAAAAMLSLTSWGYNIWVGN
ncbi:MAG: DUF2752 domain-containing protein [Synergistaceae bacterium]|nr:DUF2752 domain-containing protein [Synergistaceae bacterium]